MKTLAIVALLSAPLRADDFSAALENIRTLSYQAGAAAKAAPKVDVFSFDHAKTPQFVKDAIEKAYAGRKNHYGHDVMNKSELRLAIARTQNLIEEAFQKDGLTCQARLDTSVLDHAEGRKIADEQMKDIHAAVVVLRDELVAAVLGTKGKTPSLFDKIAADHAAIAALKKSYPGAVSGVETAAKDSAEHALRDITRVQRETAEAKIEALAESKSLKPSRYQHTSKQKVYFSVAFNETVPVLEVCTPLYEGRGQYKVCAKTSLSTGTKAGDALVDAYDKERSSSFAFQDLAPYAVKAVENCVWLEAALKDLAGR